MLMNLFNFSNTNRKDKKFAASIWKIKFVEFYIKFHTEGNEKSIKITFSFQVNFIRQGV